MLCEKCGHKMQHKVARDPWCMYQLVDDRVISALFDPDEIPEGWYDSPKAARLGAAPKRTRRTKAEIEADKLAEEQAKLGESDGDSTGHNQQCG